MYPQNSTARLDAVAAAAMSMHHIAGDGDGSDGGGGGGGVMTGPGAGVSGGDMVLSDPSSGWQGVSGDGEGERHHRTPEDMRKAKEVAEARGRRAREERAGVARAAEAAGRAEAVARREELLRVRQACLPGLVFLTHEVRSRGFFRLPAKTRQLEYSSAIPLWTEM